MHDPFQTYATANPYQGQGLTTQMGFQNPALQTLGFSSIPGGGIPQTGQIPYFGQSAQGGVIPQQLQLASILAAQAVLPQLLALSSQANGIQNPLFAAAYHNPALAAGGQNPIWASLAGQLGPQLAWQQSPYQQSGPFGFQGGSPFGQINSPFGQTGYPLAPQTWVGQGGPFGGQVPGQLNPVFSQQNVRPFQTPGIFPSAY